MNAWNSKNWSTRLPAFINPEIRQISDETLQRFLDDPQDL
jgi:hypothetical protein